MQKQSGVYLIVIVIIILILCSTLMMQAGLSVYLVRADSVEEQFEQYTLMNRIKTKSTNALCISGNRGESLLDAKIVTSIRQNIIDGNTDVFVFVESSLDVTINSKRNGTFEITRLLEL